MTHRSLNAVFAVVLTLLFIATGCSAVPHSWQRRPVVGQHSAYAAADEAMAWERLKESQFLLIPNLHQKQNPQWDEAVALLERDSVVELTSEQHSRLTQQSSWPGADDAAAPLKPYLVRGVAYWSPSWVRVRINPAGDALWVSQGSWNGETMIGLMISQSPSPLVVYLSRRPAEVFATAILSGDGIFRDDDPPVPVAPVAPVPPVAQVGVRSAYSAK